jgi:hypothetical protein
VGCGSRFTRQAAADMSLTRGSVGIQRYGLWYINSRCRCRRRRRSPSLDPTAAGGGPSNTHATAVSKNWLSGAAHTVLPLWIAKERHPECVRCFVLLECVESVGRLPSPAHEQALGAQAPKRAKRIRQFSTLQVPAANHDSTRTQQRSCGAKHGHHRRTTPRRVEGTAAKDINSGGLASREAVDAATERGHTRRSSGKPRAGLAADTPLGSC